MQVLERVFYYNIMYNDSRHNDTIYSAPKHIFKSYSQDLYLCTSEVDSDVILLPMSEVSEMCAFDVLEGMSFLLAFFIFFNLLLN